ncbi:hypothetical protein G8770_08665 [Aestuariicella hydrocarbonica]|uniref:Uncharacterized protein n=1 Tax=Pseudomaricurvus hydrocarbonicus TaxID=1470433 RepID=A0A9E5JW39_9GAMM|nr:hypothetical protein [Aestuariicella hydrocarbonica]NHO65610.1 hypothetical protein [Aestuariicella hydrocarbonica]
MTEWVKIKAINAGELIAHFELDNKAAEILHPELNPQGGVSVLVDSECYYDAIKLLAHGLPKREAVWWACLVSRQVQTPETDQNNIDALVAAEAWARKPSEENRLRCTLLAEKTKYETPASWAATAASWSTGSLAPPGEPEIQPPEYLYAHAVAGSITLAGSLLNTDDPGESLRQFIKQGINLAEGGKGLV